MEQSNRDVATIAVLMRRLKEPRLPRAKRLLEKVNVGKELSDSDIQFLKQVSEDISNSQSLVKRYPEYSGLMSRVIGLYTEIITKSLKNEKVQ